MSFLKAEATNRLKENNLIKLEGIINWEKIKEVAGTLGRSGYGPRGYDIVGMIKALILQGWYHLSDPELEEALKVRLDFMMFTGLEDKVPDDTTFCKFRGLITELNLWEKILKVINEELERKGIKVSGCKGAVIDASIIASGARPSKEIEAEVVDREEQKVEVTDREITLSKDTDARWLKKGNKSYFGYKAFVITDSDDGFIEKTHTLPANSSEITAMEEVIGDCEIKRLYADKGYASQNNRDILRNRNIHSGIMYKATSKAPLTKLQKAFNKIVSKTRFIVEQAFGTLKRKFKFVRATYFGLKKVQAQLVVKAIAFNLLKAINKVSIA